MPGRTWITRWLMPRKSEATAKAWGAACAGPVLWRDAAA
jgi:hypothetical protein